MRKKFILFILSFWLLLPAVFALNPAAITIIRSTAPTLTTDSNNPCNAGPRGAYIGFKITNVGATTLTDLKVSLGSFLPVGTFTLAGGQAATQYLGTLTPGSSDILYWYITYPCVHNTACSVNVTVSDLNPGVKTVNATVTTKSSISANAGGLINSNLWGAGAVVGQIVSFDVIYSFGNANVGDEYNIQPCGNLDFDAATFQFVNCEILTSVIPGIHVGAKDSLYIIGGLKNGSGNLVSVRYFFQVMKSNSPGTYCKPYASQTSGNQVKYTGNFDTVVLSPSPAAGVFPFVIGLTASKYNVDPCDTINYRIVVRNTSNFPASYERIKSCLPTYMHYIGINVGSEITNAMISLAPSAGSAGCVNWFGGIPSSTFPYKEFYVPAHDSLVLLFNAYADCATPYNIQTTATAIAFSGNDSSNTASQNFCLNCRGTVTGTVYDDGNALLDSMVCGTGTDAGGLVALLVNSTGLVIANQTVGINGVYTFAGVKAGNHTVRINTTPSTLGALPPSVTLPSGWVTIGEHIGTGSGYDGIVNGISATIRVTILDTFISNFGIEQLPVPYNASAISQYNPGGTLNANVSSTLFTPKDFDGIVTSIVITALPNNATSITINGTLYNGGNFPLGGITIPVNPFGNPTQPITVDPMDGTITVEIPYIAIDNATLTSATPAFVSIPFIAYPNSTIAINDDNDTYINTPVSGSVLTNDFDPQGDTQTFIGFDDPSTGIVDYTSTGTLTFIPGTDINGNPIGDAGDLVINPDGSYTFTPSSGFIGIVLVEYQVCDNGIPQACEVVTLRINVSPMPDPIDPNNNDVIANNDENVSYGQPVTGYVLQNDNDPNSNNISLIGFIDPNTSLVVPSGIINNVPGTLFDGSPVANAGTIIINAVGRYTFTPTIGFFGTIQLTYSITDDAVLPATDNALLVIHVLPDANGNLNNPPFAGDDFAITLVDVPTVGNFMLNDNDPNNDPITINNIVINPLNPTTAVLNLPTANGNITMFSNGTYRYTPNTGFIGNDQFTYQICDVTLIDPQPLCTEGTIYIVVSDMLHDFGDLPTSMGIATNLITSNISNGVPGPVGAFWLGTQVDGEITCLFGLSATGDDIDNRNGSTGDEDGLIIPDTLISGHFATFKVTVNSNTSNLTIHYGLWIDWDNDGIFEDFYANSGVTNSPTTVDQAVLVPPSYLGGNINARVRAFASAPNAGNFQGTFNNGETEDFIQAPFVITLPVELSTFTANWNHNDAIVDWTTNLEINSDYFEVERSINNGLTFESISTVEAAGNSNTPLKYRLKDEGAAFFNISTLYYRLKIVDIDGKFDYSNKVALYLSDQSSYYLNIYPNPTHNTAIINFYLGEDEKIEGNIINPLGQVIYTQVFNSTNTGQQSMEFDFKDLASGVYMIQLNTTKNAICKQILVE